MIKTQSNLKIALITDSLNQLGGAERVISVLGELFPQADIYALFGKREIASRVFKSRKVKFSILNFFPFINRFHRFYIPFYPLGVFSLNLKDYDLVISNTSAFVKGVKTKGFHLSYCHTPTRYLWDNYYLKNHPWSFILKLPVLFLKPILKKIDINFSKNPNIIMANSNFIAQKIKKYYNRQSLIIYPPYDEKKFFYKPLKKNNYYLAVGRFLFYKRFDLIIKAFNKNRKNLYIIGSGPEEERLKKLIKSPNIKIIGKVKDDNLLRQYYTKAKALIFPQVEDFGLVAVEAMACGTPVIAFQKGGAKETVINGFSGLFFNSQNEESLNRAIKNFEKNNFNNFEISEYAKKFSKKIFFKQIKEILNKQGIVI